MLCSASSQPPWSQIQGPSGGSRGLRDARARNTEKRPISSFSFNPKQGNTLHIFFHSPSNTRPSASAGPVVHPSDRSYPHNLGPEGFARSMLLQSLSPTICAYLPSDEGSNAALFWPIGLTIQFDRCCAPIEPPPHGKETQSCYSHCWRLY